MKYLRMTIPHEVVAPASIVTEGSLLNVQLLPDGTLLELAHVRANSEKLLNSMETSASTDHFAHEVVEAQDGQCYIYQHCRPTEQAQELLQLLNEYRLMVIFPIPFDEETGLTIEIIGSESDIQNGFDALPLEVRRRTSIERVGEYSPMAPRVVSALTERQREVLNAAAAVGYYDVPRRGTADEVADVVGCASSTASEHLRKIEARILSALAEE
ncbi:helix-turn-helix domain-containing protein [Haladaptatus halobius]|uniref:helix-turn-helix domain-containing protein n=1 Tax=Haladaptatus halobius TaxID=2884875 RepID=UPI001D0B6645|nr:helix-turn-helix domain-containing protein [Haladaptatus halobius]